MKIIACIPARYESSRLPGKPLTLIAGKPLILHVVERAKQVKSINDVVVLTDDERIFTVVKNAGYQAAMTDQNCANGTARIIDFLPQSDADAFLNIQGDEVLLNPVHMEQLVTEVVAAQSQMATLAHACEDSTVLSTPSAVKVVTDCQGRALYFSRQCIPALKSGALPASALIHIGVYFYTRDTLSRLAELSATPLEVAEGLEQLRALENGIPIDVIKVATSHSLSIDTPEDLAAANAHFDGQ